MKLLRVTTVSISLSLLKGQLRFLREHGFEVVAVSSGKDALEKAGQEEGVRTVEVNMHREISLWADIKSLWNLYRLFRREKPDIVHAHTPKGSLLAMVAAWVARVPHRIYFVTGLRFETATGLFRKILVTMERITCACATKVIPEGRGVLNTLRREKITSKPLEVIHNGNINGIDLDFDDPDKVEPIDLTQYNIPADVLKFIFVGRMVKDKGIHELVDAFVQINKNHPETRLILLGRFEPELDPISPQTAEIIKNHPAISTPGHVDDVRPWLRTADILVHPSYREGFPNVILEAGAMGLPCIVTNINGSNETIIPDKNGIIVPKQDAQALKDAMEYIICHPDERAEMASNARPLVASRFDRRDVHEAILEMYQKTVENPK